MGGAGSVGLDIGGDIGAAVVIGHEDWAGREIEIRPAGQAWDGTHVAFHRRRLPDGSVVAAVFPRLEAGRWEIRLRDDDGSPVTSVDVTGARVTTVDLSSR